VNLADALSLVELDQNPKPNNQVRNAVKSYEDLQWHSVALYPKEII
jgi:hypothetical protein